MSVIPQEIKFYKSSTITNTGINGGRLSKNTYTSNTLNNVFPSVSPAERTAGTIRHRKAHIKIDNADDVVSANKLIFLSDISSAAGVRNVLFEGTQRNTQANITGSEKKHGVGRLNTNVTAGSTTLIADYETGSAADTVIQSGDAVYISDDTNSFEYEVLSVSWTGEQCTIELTTGLLNDYLAATPTTISTCIKKTNVQPTVSNWVETSATGAYDESSYPVLVGNLATIEQTWTVTFTSSTTFNAAGDTIGSIGSGTISSNFSPNNIDFSAPYFTLSSAGFSGTWATNNTIVFQTHPNSTPIWIKQIVTAGASIAIDTSTITVLVQS